MAALPLRATAVLDQWSGKLGKRIGWKVVESPWIVDLPDFGRSELSVCGKKFRSKKTPNMGWMSLRYVKEKIEVPKIFVPIRSLAQDEDGKLWFNPTRGFTFCWGLDLEVIDWLEHPASPLPSDRPATKAFWLSEYYPSLQSVKLLFYLSKERYEKNKSKINEVGLDDETGIIRQLVGKPWEPYWLRGCIPAEVRVIVDPDLKAPKAKSATTSCAISGCKNPPHAHASWGGNLVVEREDSFSEGNLCKEHIGELFQQLNPLLKTGQCWLRMDYLKDEAARGWDVETVIPPLVASGSKLSISEEEDILPLPKKPKKPKPKKPKKSEPEALVEYRFLIRKAYYKPDPGRLGRRPNFRLIYWHYFSKQIDLEISLPGLEELKPTVMGMYKFTNIDTFPEFSYHTDAFLWASKHGVKLMYIPPWHTAPLPKEE